MQKNDRIFFAFYRRRKKPYLVAAVDTDVEELDLSDVLSSTSEESEASEEDVGVGHEPDGLNGVTGVAPSAAVGVEPRIVLI